MLLSIHGGLVAGSRLAVKFAFLDGNLQLCSPLLPLLFGKLALAPFESGEFLLRRLKKAVARRYCQLSVSRHYATPSIAHPDTIQVLEPGKGPVP